MSEIFSSRESPVMPYERAALRSVRDSLNKNSALLVPTTHLAASRLDRRNSGGGLQTAAGPFPGPAGLRTGGTAGAPADAAETTYR